MKRIFLDTNFIVDYFIRKEFVENAEKVMVLGRQNKYVFYVSYLTVANFAYIVRKLPAETVRSMIEDICKVFKVIKNTKDQILNVIELKPSDFEDGLQYEAALSADCDCIITRNEKDFAFSKLPVFTPTDFLIAHQN